MSGVAFLKTKFEFQNLKKNDYKMSVHYWITNNLKYLFDSHLPNGEMSIIWNKLYIFNLLNES